MLEFFRKYQRHFFLFIACVVAVSFLFFGTHQVTFTPQKRDDRLLGLAIDGSSIRKNTIDEIVLFIGSDQNDTQLIEKRKMPNFFNDGVVRRDFLSTGLGVMLADRYFNDLQEDFAKKAKEHQKHAAHHGPSSPFFRVQQLWEKLLPQQKKQLDKLIDEDLPVDSNLFSLFVDLYLGEMEFPPHALHRYAMLGQYRDQETEKKRMLNESDFSLFQCSCLEDWFGSLFLQLVGQFIHNAALFAEQQGYHVSTEEAKVDLFSNGHRALQMQKRSEPIHQKEITTLWDRQLLHLGMDERAAVTVWQKVMLMRRLFADYAQAAFVDSHPYQCFHAYASRTAHIDQYRLNNGLCLRNFDQLLKLIYYLNAVSASNDNRPNLPTGCVPIASLKQTCPRLVCHRFLVEVSSVEKAHIAQEVSLKQMWDWQMDSQNFKVLQKAFPELALSKASDAEGYFTALEGQASSLRKKIDQYSRMQIVQEHPERIVAALNEQKPTVREIIFASDGYQTQLKGIENGHTLLELFQLTPLKGEVSMDKQTRQIRSDLELFSEDGHTYYRFQVLDRDENPHIFTFTQADDQGILGPLVAHHLKKQYAQVRLEDPPLFQTDLGEWKSFQLVQQEVGRIFYKEILREVDRDLQKAGYPLPEDRFNNLDGFYPKHYFCPYMNAALLDIQEKGAESAYLAKELPRAAPNKLSSYPAFDQEWKIVKEAQSYKQCESHPQLDPSLFTMKQGEWSSVQDFGDGKMGFFQLRECHTPKTSSLQEIKRGQEILSIEAQRYLMIELLDIMREKKGIHLFYNRNAE